MRNALVPPRFMMEIQPNSEKTLHSKLRALPPRKLDRLVASVNAVSARRHFFYKDKDNHPAGMVPVVFDKATLSKVQAVARAVYRFQLKAPELYRSDHKGFAGLVQLERRTKAWFERAPAGRGGGELLNRPDFGFEMRAGRITPVLFELNSLMLGGIYIQAVALEIISRCVLPGLGVKPGSMGLKTSPDLLVYLKRWLLDCRHRAGMEQGGGIGFLETLPPGGGFSELPRIAKFFSDAGIRGGHGDARDLELRKGRVCLRGMPVDYVYRDFSFEDSGGPENRRMRLFRRLWEEGRVVPGWPAEFDQKGILECFTSEEFDPLFTRTEARLLREHVPWTRVLTERKTKDERGKRVDLAEHTLKDRESLVIKPSWSSGGDGILIGKKIKPERWRKKVEEAVAHPGAFSVQAYVDAPPRPSAYLREGKLNLKDCRYTLGAFYDGKEFGYHLRMSPKDIVNVAQGGALTPIYIAS